jgi:hypothetical protein
MAVIKIGFKMKDLSFIKWLFRVSLMDDVKEDNGFNLKNSYSSFKYEILWKSMVYVTQKSNWTIEIDELETMITSPAGGQKFFSCEGQELIDSLEDALYYYWGKQIRG